MVNFVTIPSLLTRSPTVPRFRHFFNLYISLKCNINIKRNNSNSRSAGSRVCQFHTCQTFQNIQKISVGKVITKTEYLTSGECLSTLVPLLSGQVACPSSKNSRNMIFQISSYKVTENTTVSKIDKMFSFRRILCYLELLLSSQKSFIISKSSLYCDP